MRVRAVFGCQSPPHTCAFVTDPTVAPFVAPFAEPAFTPAFSLRRNDAGGVFSSRLKLLSCAERGKCESPETRECPGAPHIRRPAQLEYAHRFHEGHARRKL